jgi:hypothetical protein
MPEQWRAVSGKKGVRVAEIEAGPYVRAVVSEVVPASGRVEYSVLLTNLPIEEFDAVALWRL